MTQALRAAAQATRFLVERQGADGLWRDFRTLAGQAEDWPTAFIGLALATVARADFGAGREEGALAAAAAQRAAAALLGRQHQDGGWGYHAGVPVDADSTALAVLLLLAATPHRDAATARALERARRCLLAHQDAESGGFSTYAGEAPIRAFMDLPAEIPLCGWCQPHVEVTAVCGQALAWLGAGEAARAAWRFVRERQAPGGAWPAYWWAAPHYATFQALALARAMRDPASDLPLEGSVAAAAWLVATQRADGAFVTAEGATAFPTALALAALALLPGDAAPARALERAAARLCALQLDDGGWRSMPSLRIPRPEVEQPAATGWRSDALGTGVLIADEQRLFTSATCLLALALWSRRGC